MAAGGYMLDLKTAAERKLIEVFQSNTCCNNVLKLKQVNLMFLSIFGILERNQSVDTGGVVG